MLKRSAAFAVISFFVLAAIVFIYVAWEVIWRAIVCIAIVAAIGVVYYGGRELLDWAIEEVQKPRE